MPSNQILALMRSWCVGLQSDSDALDRGVTLEEAMEIQERALSTLLHCPGQGFDEIERLILSTNMSVVQFCEMALDTMSQYEQPTRWQRIKKSKFGGWV
jgi:hypothetical protein